MRERERSPSPAAVQTVSSRALFWLVICPAIVSSTHLRLKQTAHWEYGSYGHPSSYVVCGDFDRDGLGDLTFWTGSRYPDNPPRWQIWECRPFDRYSLVHSDTSPYPYELGIQTGSFWPFAFGDVDGDSLPELWGIMTEQLEGGEYYYRLLLVCMESPRPGAYPDSLVWFDRVDSCSHGGSHPLWITDLDRDGKQEVLMVGHFFREFTLCAYERAGNDSYELVWNSHEWFRYDLAVGDFDLDGRSDFSSLGIWALSHECVGDNEYELVFRAPPGYPYCTEVWASRDADRNGKPEFFGTSYRYLGMQGYRFYLYYWESDGDNSYRWFFVDSVDRRAWGSHSHSSSGDIDGDGVEEVVWATGTHVSVYKGEQPGVLTKVCEQYSWHGRMDDLGVVIYDLNRNGYNEIVVGGSGKNSIYEIEAVRVLDPNGGEQLRPGDTCRISWQTFHPPRCDSVGLFLRTDTTYRLDTIATGLAPADTPYVWVVPDIQADSCWVMAIAYNHGLWQHDETDGPIRILVPGIEEGAARRVFMTRLDAYPNPARGRLEVQYEVAGAGPVELAVFDRTGRRAAILVSGRVEPGRYELAWSRQDNHGRLLPAGIYFLRMEACGKTFTMKVILSE